jgi:hypothetical protein
MSFKSKPGSCECGASVVFYGNKSRGWACGRRERFNPGTSSVGAPPATGSWEVVEICPIPALVNSTLTENNFLKQESVKLRNTISALTEQVAELEEEKKSQVAQCG